MTTIHLRRWGDDGRGTYGWLELPDEPPTATVELPWRHNAPYVSCIPTGIYPVSLSVWGSDTGGYDCLRVHDVPGRTGIYVHRANVPGELQGCIAPGNTFEVWSVDDAGRLRGDGGTSNALGVCRSTAALNRLVAHVRDLLAEGEPHLAITAEGPRG